MKFNLFLILMFFLFSSSFSYGQSNIGGSVDDSFNKDYHNVPYPRDNNPNIIDKDDIKDHLPKSDEDITFFITEFDFIGNRVIDRDDLYRVVSDYIGKHLTLNDLYEVADEVTKLYNKKGYIVSYAYIPPQVIENETVTIAIVEGKIGKVIVDGESRYKSSFIEEYLSPLKTGLILNIKDIEDRILLLNSFMGLNVRATLKAGEEQGTSDIIIHLLDDRPYRAFIGLDNYGNKETNEYRLSAAGSLANIFKGGDRLAGYFSIGLDNFDPRELFFARVDYNIPFGINGFKLGLSYTRSQYMATGKFEKLDLKGYSDEFKLYAEYPLLLRSAATINLYGGFRLKNSLEKMLGERFTADGVYNLSLGLYGSFYPVRNGEGFYNISIDQGINPIFNGSHNSKGSTVPNAGGYYQRIYGEFDYTQYIASFFRMNLYGSGQYATDNLFASEKFYIGGMYSVRGFQSGVNSGDNGFRLSAEFEADVYLPEIKAAVFFDGGWVQNYSPENIGYSSANLYSIGLALRFYPIKGLSINVDYGFPLSSTTEKLNYGIVYARVSYGF